MLYEHKFETKTKGLVCGPQHFIEHPYRPQYLRERIVSKNNKLILSDPTAATWAPVTVHHKVTISAREGGEILWQRPFATQQEALAVYLRVAGLTDGTRNGSPWLCPTKIVDGELIYAISVVTTYNESINDPTKDWLHGGTLCPSMGWWDFRLLDFTVSTWNNTTNSGASDWSTTTDNGTRCPASVTSADYLLVAGGASGSTDGTGGGGAGGVLSGTGSSVTPATNYPVTIGAGGASKAAGSASVGNDGNNSTWNSLTALKGGGGGYTGNGTGGSGTYGSGGGAGRSAAFTGGAGTAGQGNNGGNTSADNQGSGGGGGAGAVGSNGTSSTAGGAGGNGTSSSITGSPVTYGGGGGAGAQSGGNAAGGSGGGGAAGNPGTAGTDNLGGGGGAGSSAGGASGAGGKGVTILSWAVTVIFIPVPFSELVHTWRSTEIEGY